MTLQNIELTKAEIEILLYALSIMDSDFTEKDNPIKRKMLLNSVITSTVKLARAKQEF